MIIEPKIRGFLCLTSHPTGCEANIREQINYLTEQGKIAFDCRDFRIVRLDELRLMAETAAERVAHGRMPFSLSPMSSRDRRIVHLALKENPAVRPESDGGGPYRKVVIIPAEK